jgi:hypothetical protein
LNNTKRECQTGERQTELKRKKGKKTVSEKQCRHSNIDEEETKIKKSKIEKEKKERESKQTEKGTQESCLVSFNIKVNLSTQ